MIFKSNSSTTDASAMAGAIPLDGGAGDYDPLMDMIGDARYVLLGEATHGTHEFYRERARITQRLITEKGFSAVAVEADWPDAYRVNRYIRAAGSATSAREALDGFQRFPHWMWRNTEVVELVDWLRAHNDRQPEAGKVGFYGLDLYSLFTSIEEVLRSLDQVEPAAADEARARYACFDHYNEDSQHYGYATGVGLSESCEQGVAAQLRALQERARQYMQDGAEAGDAFFHAQRNASLIKNAEEYYRTMFRGRVSSWNLRDSHMADTLDALSSHLSQGRSEPARIVVWEHNSHIGDARATETARLGEWNVGQLARERYGKDTFLLGFTTYTGWVTAASRWDGAAEKKRVVPALEGSYEELFHRSGPAPRFLLPLGAAGPAAAALPARRLERAFGVLYLPKTERQSHYFSAQLADQFDAVIHIDETDAVQPLERMGAGGHEVPETYPVGV
jgi:erythromycin esterase-like protein